MGFQTCEQAEIDSAHFKGYVYAKIFYSANLCNGIVFLETFPDVSPRPNAFGVEFSFFKYFENGGFLRRSSTMIWLMVYHCKSMPKHCFAFLLNIFGTQMYKLNVYMEACLNLHAFQLNSYCLVCDGRVAIGNI